MNKILSRFYTFITCFLNLHGLKNLEGFTFAAAVAATLFLSSCSYHYYMQGKIDYNNNAYPSAIKNLEKSLLKKSYNPDASLKLANCYRILKNTKKAEELYAMEVVGANIADETILQYAKLLMNNEKYEEAKVQFTKYLEKKPDDAVAKMLMNSCQTLANFNGDTTQYTLYEQSIGNFSSLISPVPYRNGLMFAAERDGGHYEVKNPSTEKTYLDLYYAGKEGDTWTTPIALKGGINGNYHEGPFSISKDETSIYFTRSNYQKVVNKNKKGDNALKIYRATGVDTIWRNPQELSFNNNEYSVGHPFLADSGTTMYFISDMPGGIGETDIYKSKLEGGIWGTPTNISAVINTAGREMYPFVQNDTLYFSSDAHNNYGGFDVFYSKFDGANWQPPHNLMYPLNSSKDEYCYRLNKDGLTGYVVSNRTGADRIYQFKKKPPILPEIKPAADSTEAEKEFAKTKGKKLDKPANIKGIVKSDRGEPLGGVKLNFHNSIAGVQDSILTNDDGSYEFYLKPNAEYRISATKDKYFEKTVSVSTKGKDSVGMKEVDIQLMEVILGKQMLLEKIYYKLNSSYLIAESKTELNNLVDLLNKNPDLIVELSSHTDSRASEQYNIWLSERRAKSVVDYLISKGINPKTLSYKGYGESRLLNKCKDDVPCSDEEHQMNRRTEITVIKIEKK